MSTPLPAFDSIPIPDRWGLLHEARVAVDMMAGLTHLPRALLALRGHDEPVLLLPGFTAGDTSMWLLRAFLRRLGWDARGWGLGVNNGDAPAFFAKLGELAERRVARAGAPLRVVGWSMGGFLGRELARERPELISQVITMGTPVVGGPKYTAVAGLFRRRGYDLDAIAALCEARSCRPIEAPITAIYSRRDGVVAWQACIDRASPRVEHIEVESSHTGLGFDVRVWRIVANQLARGASGLLG
jgi:hypothetical protein